MAKERHIEITQTDESRNGQEVSVLRLNKQEIGYIQADSGRFLAFLAGSKTPNRFKTQDDATNYLIAEYHLHQG